MNATNTNFGGTFFLRTASIYALCATLALPAFGQSSGKPAKPADSSATKAATTTKASAPPKDSKENKPDGKDVKVTDYGTVDISVQDTDLATVLQMLSIESKKNIITSKGVSATVSANLYDVTFYEALKAILDVNGYTFYEEGNFIYVITKDEAAAMEKARRKTESRIFELSYLSPTDANEFIQPLLSADGKASARGAVQPGMKPEIANNGADEYAFTPRLVVNDYPENLEAISTLLTSLDTPPQQVLVEATILQTALDEANAFGIDFTVLGSLNFTDLANPLSAVNGLINGNDPKIGVQPANNHAQAVTSTVGNTPGAGGFKVGVISDDVSVFLRVLDEVTDTTVLARPKVMALNRQRAEVLVGARVGYLSTTSTETTTTQNVQFLDTGVQLIFRPFISTDGMIRMELKPEVSEAKLRDVTDSNGSIVTIPDELTNQVTTNVRVKDGQTLVIGGLFKDSTSTTRRQVPLLGDIPIVGAAFRGQDDKVQRSEVIFLITPSIVHDETLWAMGAEQLDSIDALRVGGRAALLPFSREKVTNNYNQKALEALNKGDHDKALYFINNSLGLAPDQPEMIRMREQITGERAHAHERSLMERTFRKQLGVTPAPTPTPTPAAPAATQPHGSADSNNTETAATAANETAANQTTSETPTAEEPVQTVSAPQTPEPQNSPSSASSSTPSNTPIAPTEHVQANPNSTADLSPNTNANSTGITGEDSTASAQKNMTPEQWMFYQQLLFDYFTTLDMPALASNFADCGLEQYRSQFPFVTTEGTNKIADAPTDSTPQN